MPRERIARNPQAEQLVWITYRGRRFPIRPGNPEYSLTENVDRAKLDQWNKEMLGKGYRDSFAGGLIRECIKEKKRGKNQVVFATDKSGQRLMGACTISKPAVPRDKTIYLDWLAAHPGHKGKGVGSTLLLRLYKQACETGSKLITFPASEAKTFYEKFGWKKKKGGDSYVITPQEIKRQTEVLEKK